jgi:hypothetical protein
VAVHADVTAGPKTLPLEFPATGTNTIIDSCAGRGLQCN